MIRSKYDKFFYFRTITDEDDDESENASLTLPCRRITGILPISTSQITIHFEQGTSQRPHDDDFNGVKHGFVNIAVNSNTSKEVIKAITEAYNSAPPGGIIVIGDDSTTDVDGSTKAPKYIHKDITGIGLIRNK
jgi:hypothetical protein